MKKSLGQNIKESNGFQIRPLPKNGIAFTMANGDVIQGPAEFWTVRNIGQRIQPEITSPLLPASMFTLERWKVTKTK